MPDCPKAHANRATHKRKKAAYTNQKRSFYHASYESYSGKRIIVSITPFGDDCCEQQVSIRTTEGINNFIVGPETYVQNNVRLRPGMNVTALYDGEQAVPLIYPPQYRAVFIGRRNPGEKVYAGYFDEALASSDGSLQLNIDTSTSVVTANGQTFQCSPGGHTLIVYYSETTRSIPAQTTPRKIIVIC